MQKRKHSTDIERKNLIWSDEMINNSVAWWKSYKIPCDYSGIDFNAEKTQQYAHVRKEMAKKYEGFGPVDAIGRRDLEHSQYEKMKK